MGPLQRAYAPAPWMFLGRYYLEAGEHILCVLHWVSVVAGHLCQPIHVGKSLVIVWLMQLPGLGEFWYLSPITSMISLGAI